MASSVATIDQGRFTERSLRVGATVFAIGILAFFAARSVNGGLAGILLVGLITWIPVATALAVVKGSWHKSQEMQTRNGLVSGCLALVALCGAGGVVFCFGEQLLIAALVGGVAAYVNHRQGWIDWRRLVGIAPNPTPSPDAPAPPPAWSVLEIAPARTGGVVLALILVVAGVFLGSLGAIRAMELGALGGDFACTAPCGVQYGLWVQVVPDAQGRLVSQPDPGVVELRLSFRDDEPGVKRVSSGDFTLTGPDPNVTYQASASRPGCGGWALHLQLDDAGKMAQLCFSVPPGAEADPAQLLLNWGSVVIPLGAQESNFAWGL